MIIYTDRSKTPFGSSIGYKSAAKRKRSGIRKKNSKRATHQRKSPRRKVKKVGKKSKKKRLSAQNVKFLKQLGFRVKKQ